MVKLNGNIRTRLTNLMATWKTNMHLHSKVVTSPSLNNKSLFLFFSISVLIANKKLIIRTKSFKVDISGHLLLRRSQDTLVSGCIPKLQTGTWKAGDAVLCWENDIKIKQVSGNSHDTQHHHTKGPEKQIFKTLPEIYFRPPQINWWHLFLLQSCPTAGSGSVD